ncbi:MAG: right-handed parallel beta-helix repeat-containing protein [Candidatus Thermoplasmatota archaeon]|nr:right-handed parallel beta-helix repeat-containing protein [Candidatus Thermoplasmatota archaeon]
MRKRIGIIFICIMLITSCITVVFPVENVKASETTIYVHPGESIQDAIDAANLGDTVFVYNGTYYENIKINKKINLIGEDRESTIISGNKKDNVIQVTDSWINISNFTIQNSGANSAGININDNHKIFNVSIINDKITDNGIGILLKNCTNITLENNNIEDNNIGIHLNASSKNTIYLNQFFYNKNGIELNYCFQNTIDNNWINRNWENGIVIKNSIQNTINSNHIFYTMEIDIFLIKSSNNNISDNIFEICNQAAIDLNDDSNMNLILDNYFYNGNVGIYQKNCSYNKIRDNNFNEFKRPIRQWNSDYNEIKNNSFTNISIEPSNQPLCFYNSNYNTIMNNYIKNYNGYGLFLGKSENNFIYKNNISSAYGISLDYQSNDNIITNNTIKVIKTVGISLDSCTNNFIENNSINCMFYYHNVSLNGISLYQSYNNKIINNTINNYQNFFEYEEAYAVYLKESLNNIIY